MESLIIEIRAYNRKRTRELNCRVKYRLKYWLVLLWIHHTTRPTRHQRKSQFQTQDKVRPCATSAAKSDIGAKNVQTKSLHWGHLLSIRKKDLGKETILLSRERERQEPTSPPKSRHRRIWHDGPRDWSSSLDIKLTVPQLSLMWKVRLINFLIDT